MRGLPQFSDEYWTKYKDKKVHLKPFDPQTRVKAYEYIEILKSLLNQYSPEILLRGSTYYGIDGKGEIEVGVYPTDENWKKVLKKIRGRVGGPRICENNFVQFPDVISEIEVEIIVIKGYEAIVDKKLTEYIKNDKKLLLEYQKLKYENCYSKLAYLKEKDKFFRKVIEMIPE